MPPEQNPNTNPQPTPETPAQPPQPSTMASPAPQAAPAPVAQPVAPQVAVVQPTVIQPSTTPPAPQAAPAETPADTTGFYQATTTPQAPVSHQVFAGGGGLVEPPKPKKNKLPFIIAGATASVLLLVAGGVFGFYLPNTEANVWNTGLDRSGKAFDKVVTEATEAKKLESYKTTDIKGKVTANFKDGSFSGDLNFKFDKTYSDGSASFTLKDESEGASSSRTISGKVMTEIPKDSNFPDIYFQYSGLKEMGLDGLVPGIGDYENQWILADAKYLESLGADYMTGKTQDEKQLTAQDIAEVARVTSQKTTEYVLTSDPEKAVFDKKEFVGKERIDELNTYHYKVGINTAHAIDYCEATTKALIDTAAYKKLSENDNAKITEEKNKARKDCEEDVKKDIKSSDSFDLWIDKKYKLIHKARIYDKEDKGKYTDIGQTYKGGDQLSLFAAYHDTKGNSDTKFTLETNLKTNKTTGVITYSSRNVESPVNFKITLESVMSADPVKIDKPTNTISIQELLQKMGIDPQQQASDNVDSQVRNDASMIAVSLNEYLANNSGKLPTGGTISNKTLVLTGNGQNSRETLDFVTSGTVSSTAEAPTVNTTINVRLGFTCNDEGTGVGTMRSRSAAILYQTSIGPGCIEA